MAVTVRRQSCERQTLALRSRADRRERLSAARNATVAMRSISEVEYDFGVKGALYAFFDHVAALAEIYASGMARASFSESRFTQRRAHQMPTQRAQSSNSLRRH